jgi:hypothetical protein
MEELSRLPESLRKHALDRYRLLQPHLEEGRPLHPLATKAEMPYVEFFTASIRNRNTRLAYARGKAVLRLVR